MIIGFTNGIALVIASTQFKDFLGLTIDVPGEFLARLEVIGAHLSEVSWPSIGLGRTRLPLIVLCNRYVPRVPGYIVALFGGTVVALLARPRRRHHRHRGSAASPRAARAPDAARSART